MLENIADFMSSDAFWIAIGSIGSFVALVFIYYQIKTSRLVSAADFLLKSEDVFYSQNMRKRRREIARLIRNRPINIVKLNSSMGALEVLDFFENLGLLVRKKVIPLEFVWSAYFYWITNYWLSVQEYVRWYRKDKQEPTYYDELEYLYAQTLRFEEKTRRRRVDITSEELQEFADAEINL